MAERNQFDFGPSSKSGMNPLRARAVLRGSRPLVKIDPRSLQQVYIVANERQADHTGAPVILPSEIASEAKALRQLGIEHIKVFVRNEKRDAMASEASNPGSFVIDVIKRWKDEAPDICLAAETCLCPFTDTGLCGVLTPDRRAIAQGSFDRLVDLAIAQADAGADVMGVANMIEGSVSRVREALTSEGWHDVSIVPHLILQSTWVYGPFRQATGVDEGIDRAATHVHPSNIDQVMAQLRRFHNEGADRVLLEPAVTVIDHLNRLHRASVCPIDAFIVSGESRMMTAGSEGVAQAGSMAASLFRAGADTIVTYAAKDLASAFSS